MLNYFPTKKEIEPKIYAYKLVGVPVKKGLLKIGYTTGDVKKRIDEQTKTARLEYDIVFIESQTVRKLWKTLFALAIYKNKWLILATKNSKGFLPCECRASLRSG